MKQKQEHILLILSDQHNHRVLGALGDPVRTPHLDALRRDGVLYANTYCNSPLCVPSRMSFLTGRLPSEIGCLHNGSSLSPEIPTIAHTMGAAGYRTVLCGRMHFIGADQNHGFEERIAGDVASEFPSTNRAEYRHRGFFGEVESVRNAGPGYSHDLSFDMHVAAEACRLIRDHEVSGDPRPLFLVIGFYSPHDPYRCPRELFEHYSADGDAPYGPDRFSSDPQAAERSRRHQFDRLSETQRGRAAAAYRGKTEFLDRLIGHCLACWAESPFSQDSHIIYTSDHGDMLGSHRLWAKQVFHEHAARVPLIWKHASLAPGTTIQSPASLLDLSHTLTRIANAPALPFSRGCDLREVPGDHSVIAELWSGKSSGPSRMSRIADWKTVHHHALPAIVYNLAEDPDEIRPLNIESLPPAIRNLVDQQVLAGWDPDTLLAEKNLAAPQNALIRDWVHRSKPHSSIQWGMPAEL